jgi:hypothetical protein
VKPLWRIGLQGWHGIIPPPGACTDLIDSTLRVRQTDTGCDLGEGYERWFVPVSVS